MILSLGHRHCVRAMAETQLTCTATQKCPAIDTEVFRESELLQIKLFGNFEVVDC
jgi:hypothetical protein